MNGERTELERRSNGARTEDERRTNGERTELERSSNGARTEDERRTNGERTENDTGNIPSEVLGRLRYVFIVDDFSEVNNSQF